MAGPVQAQYGGGPLCVENHRRLSRLSQRAAILRSIRPFLATCGMSDRRAADQPGRLVAATSAQPIVWI